MAASAIGVNSGCGGGGGGVGVGVAVSWRVLVLGIKRACMIRRRRGIRGVIVYRIMLV